MKNLLATFTLAASLAGCATPYAPQDFDFSGFATSGIIESVRQVPRDIHAFQDAIEHHINPEVAEELVIRLDDGRAVTLREAHATRLAAGQRVRLLGDELALE